MLKFLCVLQVLGKVKQSAEFQHCSSIHRAVMEYVFAVGFALYVPQNWGFWSF